MRKDLVRILDSYASPLVLMSPATTEADVDLRSSVFEQAAQDLAAAR